MGVLIPNASGYGGLDNSPLARPDYYEKILDRRYERDWIYEVTNSEIAERITADTQQVQVMKSPTVGNWRPYSKNQGMVPGQVSLVSDCISIDKAAYLDLKFDDLDIHWTGSRYPQFESKFLESAYQNYVAMQRSWVVNGLLGEADPRNQGPHAGKYGDMNLGERGNPVVITPANLAANLSYLQRVLIEQLAWPEGTSQKPFILMPPQFRSILVQSNFANAAWIGTADSGNRVIDGLLPGNPMGFNIIETIHAPDRREANGDLCFYIIAGSPEAYAYAGEIIRSRVLNTDRSTFGVEYQMLAVWGGKMLYPEKLAVAYWHFSG